MYNTRILIRGNLLLPDLPAVVVAAGLRHEDLDDPVAAPMVNNDLSPCAHSEPRPSQNRRVAGDFCSFPSLAVRVWWFANSADCVGLKVIYGLDRN